MRAPKYTHVHVQKKTPSMQSQQQRVPKKPSDNHVSLFRFFSQTRAPTSVLACVSAYAAVVAVVCVSLVVFQSNVKEIVAFTAGVVALVVALFAFEVTRKRIAQLRFESADRPDLRGFLREVKVSSHQDVRALLRMKHMWYGCTHNIEEAKKMHHILQSKQSNAADKAKEAMQYETAVLGCHHPPPSTSREKGHT